LNHAPHLELPDLTHHVLRPVDIDTVLIRKVCFLSAAAIALLVTFFLHLLHKLLLVSVLCSLIDVSLEFDEKIAEPVVTESLVTLQSLGRVYLQTCLYKLYHLLFVFREKRVHLA
jgi:hypothetical protein